MSPTPQEMYPFFFLNKDGIERTAAADESFLQLLASGLQIVTVCEHGNYNSGELAYFLNCNGVPAARLKDGLQGFWHKSENNEHVIRNLSHVPYVVVLFADYLSDVYNDIYVQLCRNCTVLHYDSHEVAKQEIFTSLPSYGFGVQMRPTKSDSPFGRDFTLRDR